MKLFFSLNTVLLSPLEQFEWTNFTYGACSHGYSSPSIASHGWVLGGFVCLVLLDSIRNSFAFTPGLLGWLYKKILLFIYQTIVNLFGNVSTPIISILMFVFFTIFLANFAGMIPYTTAITSSIAVTFSVSLSVFTGILISSVLENGVGIFKLFVPAGVPLLLIPLLTVIEFISYFSRVFSLAIRLFANILSGHILLKILLTGLSSTAHCPHFLGYILATFPLAIILVVILLEFLVAVLQAYVFTLLCSLFLKEGLAGGH